MPSHHPAGVTVMAASILASTMPGGLTPQCEECGIALCWDIPQEDYDACPEFWDRWKCQDCNGGVRMHPPQVSP
jgi:hypothetical protein